MPLDRSRIKKGAFLTSTPIPPGYTVKRQPLPDDLKHFDEAAAVADRLASTSSLDEIRQRIKHAQVNCAPL
jgi:hypothetical protein